MATIVKNMLLIAEDHLFTLLLRECRHRRYFYLSVVFWSLPSKKFG
jgi:hypothetical protein